MTTYQIANRWDMNETAHSCSHSQRIINYLPAPLGKDISTGIRELLAETIFTSCGSGSWCDAVFSQLKENVTRDYFFGSWTVNYLPTEGNVVDTTPPTIAEKLIKVQDTFGLSTATLADILRASRASVYNWFENETPSTVFVQRIEKLYEIAQEWEDHNPYHYAPGRLMKQKLGDAPSMYELLSHEELIRDEICNGMESLLALMNKQQEKMDRAKTRSEKASADTESHRELLERLTGSITADE